VLVDQKVDDLGLAAAANRRFDAGTVIVSLDMNDSVGLVDADLLSRHIRS